jgi:hypothetical protein
LKIFRTDERPHFNRSQPRRTLLLSRPHHENVIVRFDLIQEKKQDPRLASVTMVNPELSLRPQKAARETGARENKVDCPRRFPEIMQYESLTLFLTLVSIQSIRKNLISSPVAPKGDQLLCLWIAPTLSSNHLVLRNEQGYSWAIILNDSVRLHDLGTRPSTKFRSSLSQILRSSTTPISLRQSRSLE